jgi:hypothetical protein
MSDERIAALERVQALEDTVSICQLIATYGPAVDSECGSAVGGVWAEDSVYDAGGTRPYVGRASVADRVCGERHQRYVQAGCAHVLSMHQVAVDVAVAVNHSRVYLRDGAHWRLERVSANRWELERIDGTWQVERRTSRQLDGSPEARALLASVLP